MRVCKTEAVSLTQEYGIYETGGMHLRASEMRIRYYTTNGSTPVKLVFQTVIRVQPVWQRARNFAK